MHLREDDLIVILYRAAYYRPLDVPGPLDKRGYGLARNSDSAYLGTMIVGIST